MRTVVPSPLAAAAAADPDSDDGEAGGLDSDDASSRDSNGIGGDISIYARKMTKNKFGSSSNNNKRTVTTSHATGDGT